LDRIIGKACEVIYHNSQYLTYAKLRYTLEETNQDILILGSSRASNQFDSRVFERNTGLSTYNCGFGGQGLQFSYIQLCESVKRYKPKLVVLDLSPNILMDPGSKDKLKALLPYYKYDTLIFNALTYNDKIEKVKLMSAIYPYNSTIGSLIRGLTMEFTDSLKGYDPISSNFDTAGIFNKVNEEYNLAEIPAAKFADLNNIINACLINEIQLIIVVCPIFQRNKNLDEMIEQIRHVCTANRKILFVDYSKSQIFENKPGLFYDNLHLNDTGSEIFSDSLSREISALIKR
jgi:hypothetical protein